MNMQRLIDQTDFDNLNELSKRWKKDSATPSLADSQLSIAKGVAERAVPEKNVCLEKQQHSKQITFQPPHSNSQIVRSQNSMSQYHKKKREVLPQIIDEDTQHFRNRLQNLLNCFKTDAVSEFMSMKKSMLEYQKDTIKGDTQKYLTMYEEKHQELLQAKQKLISLTSDVERKSMQIELMSNHISKLNDRVKITRYLSRPFALLYENKEKEKMIKFKLREAGKHDDRRLKIRSLNGWRNIFREAKQEREQEINNNKVEMEVSEIVGRFQKEMDTLKQKLAEANRKNEQYENSKHLIQENLKKAFLRGISSMNMQAMGIFGAGLETEERERRNDNNQHIMANLSYVDNPMGFSRTTNQNPLNQTTANIPSNGSYMIGKPKIESKDHKWKQAPILGVEEKQQIEQPRPQLIKPTFQGKVIKIVDGKSNVQSKRTSNTNLYPNTLNSSKLQSNSKKRI